MLKKHQNISVIKQNKLIFNRSNLKFCISTPRLNVLRHRLKEHCVSTNFSKIQTLRLSVNINNYLNCALWSCAY